MNLKSEKNIGLRHGTKTEKEFFKIPQAIWEQMDNWLLKQKHTAEVEPLRQYITRQNHTAHQYLEFAIYHFIPLMLEFRQHFKQVTFDLIYELCQLIMIINGSIVYTNKLEHLYLRIARFLCLCDIHLPDSMSSIYLHSLIHFPRQMKRWGPPKYFSCFSFERQIHEYTKQGKIKQTKHGGKAVDSLHQKDTVRNKCNIPLQRLYQPFTKQSTKIAQEFDKLSLNNIEPYLEDYPSLLNKPPQLLGTEQDFYINYDTQQGKQLFQFLLEQDTNFNQQMKQLWEIYAQWHNFEPNKIQPSKHFIHWMKANKLSSKYGQMIANIPNAMLQFNSMNNSNLKFETYSAGKHKRQINYYGIFTHKNKEIIGIIKTIGRLYFNAQFYTLVYLEQFMPQCIIEQQGYGNIIRPYQGQYHTEKVETNSWRMANEIKDKPVIKTLSGGDIYYIRHRYWLTEEYERKNILLEKY